MTERETFFSTPGGFGGGNSSNPADQTLGTQGGGGAGLGGAIYVMRGASLNIEGGSFSGGEVQGGRGGGATPGAGTNGIGAGEILFLGGNVTLNPRAGQTLTLQGDLAGGGADTRVGDPGVNGGTVNVETNQTPYAQNPEAQGSLTIGGEGTVVLSTLNTYSGATRVTGSANLVLSAVQSAGWTPSVTIESQGRLTLAASHAFHADAELFLNSGTLGFSAPSVHQTLRTGDLNEGTIIDFGGFDAGLAFSTLQIRGPMSVWSWAPGVSSLSVLGPVPAEEVSYIQF